MAARSWEVKGLKEKTQLKNAAKIVLNKKINVLLSSIKKYFKDESVENLHRVRISLRRVRYNLEIFIVSFDKKIFLIFYNVIELLQDLSGELRDLDVLIENINMIKNENVPVSAELIKKVEEKRSILKEKFNLAVMKFVQSKELKEFKKMLK